MTNCGRGGGSFLDCLNDNDKHQTFEGELHCLYFFPTYTIVFITLLVSDTLHVLLKTYGWSGDLKSHKIINKSSTTRTASFFLKQSNVVTPYHHNHYETPWQFRWLNDTQYNGYNVEGCIKRNWFNKVNIVKVDIKDIHIGVIRNRKS